MDQADKNLPDPNGQIKSARPAATTTAQIGGGQRLIQQGDIYWNPLDAPEESEPGYIHPHVVIQDNILNRSRIKTVVVCALTSNRKRANAPGNVLLEAGEANLPRQSVVEVSKLATADKSQFGDYIGSLTGPRIQQILAGMQFLQFLTDPRGSSGET